MNRWIKFSVNLLMLLVISSSALVNAAPAAARHGNNGTVKIHDGDGEPNPIYKNNPKVGCEFHIHGFGFDPGQSGGWEISQHPPTGREVVLSDEYVADAEGNWRTAVLELPNDHYKLTVEGVKGAGKHKTFWVECKPPEPTPTPPPPTPTPTPTVTPPPPPPEPEFPLHEVAVCDQEPDEIELRVLNDSDKAVRVLGELYAQHQDQEPVRISAVPEQYQACPPGGWCGPEERIRNHFSYFDGVVWGWIEVRDLQTDDLLKRYEMEPQEPEGNPCGEITPVFSGNDGGSCEVVWMNLLYESGSSKIYWEGEIRAGNTTVASNSGWLEAGSESYANLGWNPDLSDLTGDSIDHLISGSIRAYTEPGGELLFEHQINGGAGHQLTCKVQVELSCKGARIFGQVDGDPLLEWKVNGQSGSQAVEGPFDIFVPWDPSIEGQYGPFDKQAKAKLKNGEHLLARASEEAALTCAAPEAYINTTVECGGLEVTGFTDISTTVQWTFGGEEGQQEVGPGEFEFLVGTLVETYGHHELTGSASMTVGDVTYTDEDQQEEVVCGEKERPPKPSCPTCGPHVDEFVPGGISIFWTGITECRVLWDEKKERWCVDFTSVAGILSDGIEFSVYDMDEEAFYPADSIVGNDGKTYYFLDDLDPAGDWVIFEGIHEGEAYPFWEGGYTRIRDVVGHENVEKFSSCGVTPGYWDTDESGNAHFRYLRNHNISEWAEFVREEFGLNYKDSVEWAEQLKEAGTLPLPTGP